MIKINNEMVYRYINGLDIDGVSIDDLENDPAFMIEVIKRTKDKKMFYFSGNRVRRDFEFIKYVVTTFSYDVDFITEVATEFIDYPKLPDIHTKEMAILMTDLLSKKREVNVFNLKALTFYAEETIRANLVKDKLHEEGLDYSLFYITQSEYGESEIITRYCAEKMLNEILFVTQNFEEEIHRKISSFEQIQKMGKNTFLLLMIRRRDNALADYLAFHIDLLEGPRKELDVIQKNWTNYENIFDERRIELFYDEIDRIVSDAMDQVRFVAPQLALFVKKKMRLEDWFKKHDKFPEPEIEGLELDDSFFTKQNLNFREHSCVNEALKIARELFIEKRLPSLNDEQDIKTEIIDITKLQKVMK